MALVVKNPPANAGYPRDTVPVPGLGWSPGEGNGNPLQYSWLENLMDRVGMVHGVAKNWTWLKHLVSRAKHIIIIYFYNITLLHWGHFFCMVENIMLFYGDNKDAYFTFLGGSIIYYMYNAWLVTDIWRNSKEICNSLCFSKSRFEDIRHKDVKSVKLRNLRNEAMKRYPK